MKLIIVTICLSLIVFIKQTDAHPVEDCDSSPSSYLASLVVGEVMKMGKMMMYMKVKGTCINMKMNEDHMRIIRTCATETVTDIMGQIGSGDNDFDYDDLKEAFQKITSCEMNKISNIDIKSGLDLDYFKEKSAKMISECSADDETEDLLTEIMTSCADRHIVGDKGDAAFKEIIKVKSCFLTNLVETCEQNRKDPGLLVTTFNSFMTLMDDPKCVAPIGAEVMINPIRECLEEVNDDWEDDDSHPEKFTLNNNDMEENIEDAFKFFKNYMTDIVMKSCSCTGQKLGMLTKAENNNLMISESNKLKFLVNLEFDNATERETVLSLMMKCLPRDDPELLEIDNVIGSLEKGSDDQQCMIYHKLLMYKKKEDDCMADDMVKTCGLNNDISKLMLPLINFEYMNMMVKDFVAKGGIIAGMHLMGALRESVDVEKLFSSY